MKRKVIKLGTATLVTSLPKKWVDQFGVKAGDYLEISFQNKNLILSSDKNIAVQEKILDCRKMNSRLMEEHLLACYMLGYHTIEILHDPTIPQYRSKSQLRATEFILERVNQLMIGVEIIEQSESRTVIKELATTSPDETLNTLRRILLLSKDMGESLLRALDQNDRASIADMHTRHRTIRKFLTYLQRILNKEGFKDFAKSNVAFALADNLWFISGTYRFIADAALDTKKTFGKPALEIFKLANSAFDGLHHLLFNYKPERAMELLHLREIIWDKISIATKKATPEEAALYARLAFIGGHIMHCVRAKLMMEL